jgi:hypothetical protein
MYAGYAAKNQLIFASMRAREKASRRRFCFR